MINTEQMKTPVLLGRSSFPPTLSLLSFSRSCTSPLGSSSQASPRPQSAWPCSSPFYGSSPFLFLLLGAFLRFSNSSRIRAFNSAARSTFPSLVASRPLPSPLL